MFSFPISQFPCPFPINPRFKMQNQSKSISVAKTFASSVLFFRERLRSPVVEESTYSTLSRPINQITAFCLLSLWFWLCAYATKTRLQEDSPSWYCNFVQKSLTEIPRIYHKYAHINHHTSNKFWIILHTLYRLYSHSLSLSHTLKSSMAIKLASNLHIFTILMCFGDFLMRLFMVLCAFYANFAAIP